MKEIAKVFSKNGFVGKNGSGLSGGQKKLFGYYAPYSE